jgi:serine/threonine-protein kinase
VASSSSSSNRSAARARRAAARAEAKAKRASARVARAPARTFAPSVAAAPATSGSDGALRVNSRPWSQVYVDGRLVGNTPLLNLPLRAGKHKVKLVNPELGMSKQMTVQIDKGKATTKVVELQ